MANQTENYKLTKPLASEFYDVEVQNGNMDKIDEALTENTNKIQAIQENQNASIPLTQKGAASGVATLDENGRLPAAQLPSAIDCGVWDNTPPENIVIHDANPLAHQNLLVDGNNAVGVDNSQTLEEHMASPYAHQNLIVDGNNT